MLFYRSTKCASTGCPKQFPRYLPTWQQDLKPWRVCLSCHLCSTFLSWPPLYWSQINILKHLERVSAQLYTTFVHTCIAVPHSTHFQIWKGEIFAFQSMIQYSETLYSREKDLEGTAIVRALLPLPCSRLVWSQHHYFRCSV